MSDDYAFRHHATGKNCRVVAIHEESSLGGNMVTVEFRNGETQLIHSDYITPVRLLPDWIEEDRNAEFIP